jgi:hypothetical protein
MAFSLADPTIGAVSLTATETSQGTLPLGTIVKGIDPTYGMGEFIYLKGVASTVVGDAVVYDSAFQTTRTVAASRGPVAVALSANVANQFGWYQISGLAVVKAATVASGGPAQLTATAGTLDDTTTATNYVDGAVFKSADGTPSAGFAILAMSRPCANGR